MIRRKMAFCAAIGLLVVMAAGVYAAGSVLAAPHRASVGELPADLAGRPVQFHGAAGANLEGWFISSDRRRGTIILMHGVRANRLMMLDRARFLNRAGFSILLYDSRGHGESTGDVTFGYLESQDAADAVRLVRSLVPDQPIGVIGVSLGAAALLATPPLPVDALVLESVYPTIEQAISNRIRMRLGSWVGILTPLLTMQLGPRLGFRADLLRPIDHVAVIKTPELFVAGTADRQTTIEESLHLFDRAAGPKDMWTIQGAGHVDLYQYAGKEYEERILSFLDTHLTVAAGALQAISGSRNFAGAPDAAATASAER